MALQGEAQHSAKAEGRALAKANDGWLPLWDEAAGAYYYYHAKTGDVRWERPAAAVSAEVAAAEATTAATTAVTAEEEVGLMTARRSEAYAWKQEFDGREADPVHDEWEVHTTSEGHRCVFVLPARSQNPEAKDTLSPSCHAGLHC